MTRGERAFHRLSARRTTLTLLILLGGIMCFGLVVPQHVSGEAIGHAYSSSITQVVVGLELHRLESSWLTQLLFILLTLNVFAIGLRRSLGIRATATLAPARSAMQRAAITVDTSTNRLDEWIQQRLPRSGPRLLNRNHAIGVLGFRSESVILCLAGVAVLAAAAIIGTRADLGYITVVEGADDAARSRFTSVQIRQNSELPWKAPFEMECDRSQDSTLAGPRRCIIVWNKKRHEATVKPGTDLEFLGLRLTLVGLERLPLSGSLDIDVHYQDVGHSRTTSAVSTPVDITIPPGRITALLGGATNGSPIGILPGKVGLDQVVDRLSISARPRAALAFRVSNTQHIPYVWIGSGLLLLGILGVTLLPSYSVSIRRTNSDIELQVAGYGAFANTERLLSRLTPPTAAQGAE